MSASECFWLFFFVFFFKQKTAYEMRISDWSSDVCSSDLRVQIGDGDALQFDEDVVGRVRVGPDLLIDEGPRARDESNGRPRGAEVVALQIVDRRRDAGDRKSVV